MPSSGKVKTKRHLFSYLVLAGSECWSMCQSLQTETNYHIMYFWLVQVAPQLVALYWLMVFIHETHVMPSNGKVKTKSHLFSCLVLAGSVSANVLVAPNRNKLPHNVNLSGTGFTHLLALYWLMVFIHETHVMPSSGKVYTKRHLFSYLVISGSECCPMCQLIHTGTNYHYTYIWMVLVAPIFWHYIDWWCLFMKHMWCHLVAK